MKRLLTKILCALLCVTAMFTLASCSFGEIKAPSVKGTLLSGDQLKADLEAIIQDMEDDTEIHEGWYRLSIEAQKVEETATKKTTTDEKLTGKMFVSPFEYEVKYELKYEQEKVVFNKETNTKKTVKIKGETIYLNGKYYTEMTTETVDEFSREKLTEKNFSLPEVVGVETEEIKQLIDIKTMLLLMSVMSVSPDASLYELKDGYAAKAIGEEDTSIITFTYDDDTYELKEAVVYLKKQSVSENYSNTSVTKFEAKKTLFGSVRAPRNIEDYNGGK